MKGAIFASAAAAFVGSALASDGIHRRHEALHQRHYAASVETSIPASSIVASSVIASAPASSPTLGGGHEVCGCTTKVITYYGSPTLAPISTATPAPESTTTSTTTIHSTSTSTLTVTVTPTPSSSEAPASSSEAPASSSEAPAPSSEAPAPSTEAPAPSSEAPALSSIIPSVPAVSLPTPAVTNFPSTGVFTIPANTVTVTKSTTVCGATSTALPSGKHTIGQVTTVVSTATTVTCPYATVKPSGSTSTSVIETTTYVCPSSGTYTVVPGTTTDIPSSTVVIYPTPHTLTPGTYTQTESTVTVTDTKSTYVCPYETGAPTSAPAPAPATTTSAAPAETPSSEPSSQPSGGSTVLGEGKYGMTYSPYSSDGGCKTKQEVLKDIKDVKSKGFNLVRVYSTDCSSLEFIGEACKQLGLDMIIGVFIDEKGIEGAKKDVSAITNWGQWDMVKLIVVGNEAIQNGYATAGELSGFIKWSKHVWEAKGYKGHVTTTEPVNVWQSNKSLCTAVDVVGANIHPFFNAQTTAEQAGEFVAKEFKLLESICGKDKDILNLETGWPTEGQTNGAAVPGKSQQAAAIKSLAKHVGSKSIFFSFANDLWKPAGNFGVERYWGCADSFT